MKDFTEFDKEYAKNINKIYKWMARGKDGDLFVFSGKPYKTATKWLAPACASALVWEDEIYINQPFEAVQWGDDEPVLISDIYNPKILNNKERKYLTAVLKPFHDKVKYVEKRVESVSNKDWSNKEYVFVAFYGRGMIDMPDFEAGTMYSGMERDREYTLDELGIIF